MFQSHSYIDLLYFDMAPIPLLLINYRGEIIHQNNECEILPLANGENVTLDGILSQPLWHEIVEYFFSSENLNQTPFNKSVQLLKTNTRYLLKINVATLIPTKTYIVSLLPEQQKQPENSFSLEQLPLGIAMVGIDGQFTQINTKFCCLLGYEENELLTMKDRDITYPADFKKEIEIRKSANFLSTSTYHIDKRYLHKNGKLVWVRVFVSLIKDNVSSPAYLVAAFNIQQEKQFQEVIFRSERRFRAIAENVRCVVWISGVDPMNLLYVNQCYDDVWEDSIASLYSDAKAFLEKIHPTERELVIQTRFSVLSESWCLNYRLIFEDGRTKHIRDSGHCVFDERGELIYRVGTVTDITVEIEQRDNMMVTAKKLRKLVDFDTLTGIKSRRAIMRDIDSAFQQFELTGDVSVLVYIDADGFKFINDNHGHEMGDVVLIEISDHIQNHIRDTDEVGRIGGDEFVVLLRHTSLADIPTVMERLSLNIQAKKVPNDIVVSVSVGAIELSSFICSADQWLSEADKIMYKNKRLRKKSSRRYNAIR